MTVVLRRATIIRKFFRDNLIGILLISFVGSLLATFVSSYLTKQQPASGSIVKDLLLHPIPALSLLPYSLAILAAFAVYLSWQTVRHGREVSRLRSESERELHDLREQNKGLQASVKQIESQLDPRLNVVRRIALVLLDPPPYSDFTVEDVCRRVTAFEGNAATQTEIAEALASMLGAGAVYKSGRGLELSNNWRDRLQVMGLNDSKKID